MVFEQTTAPFAASQVTASGSFAISAARAALCGTCAIVSRGIEDALGPAGSRRSTTISLKGTFCTKKGEWVVISFCPGKALIDSQSDRQACGCKWASRSEEHTSELQSLMRISYAVFCLKKKKKRDYKNT